jgi:Bacterial Ig-like domain (group 2)
MRAISLSRIIAALAALALVSACSDDPTGPSPSVREPSRGRMSVTPASATITAGEVLVLTAEMTTGTGDRFQPVGIIWTSSNDAIALVSPGGEVLGTREGQVTISATFGEETRSSSIRVLPGKQGKDQPQPED